MALIDIETLIKSKRLIFTAGSTGLQSYRARAIQSYLHMVVNNQRSACTASKRAAESQGFSEKWGECMVRKWTHAWVTQQVLPTSKRGAHGKTLSLLDDPAIRAELRSYLQSNKWAMDPVKLVNFTKNSMIPAAADKYVHHIVKHEMPAGLKKYMELELFPHIHLKAKKGVSLTTAQEFLWKEGFQYTEHKKGLYYDGHERPDVVKY
ncbi:hypothetical protein M422DRAFT_272091 [Sphaerobolus stellatus SS14]|uniref:Uncharacterized protein n=1 Tax=Sphaerobolus stellatus (strain SS14) TaxID=990650 RepID=A0A0C9TYA1_SPHS4|nr:hypothetical protein M422DRAFT_272091 [Sphaerobolus stellatus SS14]